MLGGRERLCLSWWTANPPPHNVPWKSLKKSWNCLIDYQVIVSSKKDTFQWTLTEHELANKKRLSMSMPMIHQFTSNTKLIFSQITTKFHLSFLTGIYLFIFPCLARVGLQVSSPVKVKTGKKIETFKVTHTPFDALFFLAHSWNSVREVEQTSVSDVANF